MKTKISVGVVAAVALLMILSVAFSALPGAPVAAAPMAAPTPVSVSSGSGETDFATFASIEAITADKRSGCVDVARFKQADVQYLVDVTTANTTTVTMQFTNDKVTYNDGLAVASAITADGSAMQQFPVFGRYMCMYVNVTNSNPITWTITAVLK